MPKAPYIELRDAIAADLAAATFAAPLIVLATHRPMIDLPAGVNEAIVVNIFHLARQTEHVQRNHVDRTYQTIVAIHQSITDQNATALDALTDNFESLAHDIELYLERRNYLSDRFLWTAFETPGADKLPFIVDVYDRANHLLSVLQLTHLEND